MRRWPENSNISPTENRVAKKYDILTEILPTVQVGLFARCIYLQVWNALRFYRPKTVRIAYFLATFSSLISPAPSPHPPPFARFSLAALLVGVTSSCKSRESGVSPDAGPFGAV